jgi:hypothetical protein
MQHPGMPWRLRSATSSLISSMFISSTICPTPQCGSEADASQQQQPTCSTLCPSTSACLGSSEAVRAADTSESRPAGCEKCQHDARTCVDMVHTSKKQGSTHSSAVKQIHSSTSTNPRYTAHHAMELITCSRSMHHQF